MATPITKNTFSSRVFYVCQINNLKTLEDVANAGRRFFRQQPNCGAISLREIEKTLQYNNLKFFDDTEESKIKTSLIEEERYERTKEKFAMCALQGLLANPALQEEILKRGGANSGWIEETAWSWAEGMLEARKRGKDAAQ